MQYKELETKKRMSSSSLGASRTAGVGVRAGGTAPLGGSNSEEKLICPPAPQDSERQLLHDRILQINPLLSSHSTDEETEIWRSESSKSQ